jgi:LysM repeat protein
LKYEGDASQNIGRGSGTFTAAAYQIVNDIPEGTTLHFSVWVFQENNSSSGAQTRVGIGSNVGGNPLAPAITWSDWSRAVRSWQQLNVEATVPAGSVTVFIYSTQSQPNDPNQVYYDDSRLVAAGTGEVNVGSGGDSNGDGTPDATARPTNTPAPVFAPFVAAQGADDSGRIEHVVQSGDTLAAISVAYGVPLSEILQLNSLERGSVLSLGQTILIQEGGKEPTLVPATATAQGDTGSGGGFASPTVQEVAVNATEATTAEEGEPQAPTEVPTESEPTEPPTATPVPPTATDAPPAPLETGYSVDPLALVAALCVLLFNDVNLNIIRDAEEALLANGVITLHADSSNDEQVYTTTGEIEPYCYSGIETGEYVVSAVPPAGFGLRSGSRLVNVPPGQQFLVRFAAIQGLETTIVPTTAADNAITDANSQIVEEPEDNMRNLRNIAGIIVFALAGVVLVGGIGAAIVASRR